MNAKDEKWKFLKIRKKQCNLALMDYIFDKAKSFQLEISKNTDILKHSQKAEEMIKELKPYLIEELDDEGNDNDSTICNKCRRYSFKANEMTKSILNKYNEEEFNFWNYLMGRNDIIFKKTRKNFGLLFIVSKEVV